MEGPLATAIRGWNAAGELIAIGYICADGGWSWAALKGGLLADAIALLILRHEISPDLEAELAAIIITDSALRFLKCVALTMRSHFFAPVIGVVDAQGTQLLHLVEWPSSSSILIATTNDSAGSAFIATMASALPERLRLERMDVSQ